MTRVLLLTLLCLSAQAVADVAPARGRLLVATRELQDPNFAETVILIIEHDEGGTLGVVINRPSQVRPADLFPRLAGARDYQGRLYYGGPIALLNAFALIRAVQPPRDAEHVFDNVYASGSLTVLADNPGSEERVRLYMGHAGWAPGQLDAEIAWGSWQVMPGDAGLVFANDSESVWRSLVLPRRELVNAVSMSNARG
jgi:putative transcriptional regulator